MTSGSSLDRKWQNIGSESWGNHLLTDKAFTVIREYASEIIAVSLTNIVIFCPTSNDKVATFEARRRPFNHEMICTE